MVADALSAFAVAPRESVESDSDSELAQEMNSALEHVCELGRIDGEQLAERIIDIYSENNGEEPNVEELSEMFSNIVDTFADEAAEKNKCKEMSESTHHRLSQV